ncbi:Xanthine dehydrogenase molybdenum-binding subunit [Luteitalea pratensis]|uniref:Xanthine dehydrogenase molybdenum-binding subunit n=1 Tax=Luteitalea pratensis TaxID=1855912 RepID=A0A143PEP5_LUTPR|nr:xanthine dehydrogenase molybdopterin binding subunit [Luteitalea pratensis]AMY07017.1 Xanthine dehydrogenase molybdenum-binding subunit [Luteitalea pratensis]
MTARDARGPVPIVGAAVPHESAAGHVTGAALYTDDLLARYPGLLHAWPVLSPHAHARLLSLDTAPALEVPRVVTVLTSADVPGEGDTGPARRDEPLFPDEVMFHHQPVAWVLAETLDDAQRGAARVIAEYEELPAILTIDDAIAHDAYLAGPFRITRGDVGAVETCALQCTGELRIGGQEHFYLETQAALAWLDETDGVALHSSTQHPSETQEVVARVLGVPRHRVTVECLRMGGGFGGKETQASAWAAIAALAAWKTKCPVRVRLTRQLDMALTGKRHPYLARYEAGFAKDGTLQALRLSLWSDGGYSLDLSTAIMWRSMFHCDNAYHLRAVDVVGYVCRTHKTSQTALRGFGGPQGMVVIEEILAQAAARLGLPADTIRERNFYRPGDTSHYGQPVEGAERLATIWTMLKETSDFDRRRAEVTAFNAGSPHLKRGLAITPAKFGISFTATFYNQGSALVLVYRDGSVQVNHGGTEMGQGLFTKVRQIAAGALGVSADRVRLMPTRTDKVPNTSATAASSGTDLNGAAVEDACRQIIARLTTVAAGILECDPSMVRISSGLVSGGGRSVPFADVCEAAYHARVPLFAQGFYRTPGIHFDPATGQGHPFYYFTYGAAVSEVEVDRFTGAHRLRRVDILQDVGDAISPIVDRGQIEGGFIQGAGWLTVEDLLWDGEGRLATGSASTYKLPSWSEVPERFEVAFLPRATQPGVVSGSKAVGEPPLMLAISVREALRDAVAAFGDRNGAARPVVTFDSPATPERVFFAIQAHVR